MKGYCSNCKQIKEMKDVKKEKLKNGDMVFTGRCSDCQNIIYKKEK